MAQAVKYLQNTKYPAGCGIKILGVTLPGAEKVVTSKYQKVGVLATQSTVNNRAYGDRVRMLDPSVFVTEIAVPGLVNLLEMDNRDMNAINNLLKQAIVCFEPDTQALVLGCTHYPLVTKEILENWKTIHGTTIEIVDPGLEAAKKFKDYLERHPEFQLSVGGKTNLKFNKKSISPVASSQNIIPN